MDEETTNTQPTEDVTADQTSTETPAEVGGDSTEQAAPAPVEGEGDNAADGETDAADTEGEDSGTQAV